MGLLQDGHCSLFSDDSFIFFNLETKKVEMQWHNTKLNKGTKQRAGENFKLPNGSLSCEVIPETKKAKPKKRDASLLHM